MSRFTLDAHDRVVPTGALPRREFPLIENDPATPASGRRMSVKMSADATDAIAKFTAAAKDPRTTNQVYICGFADGAKSVDRWAPAFAGLITGSVLTAAIISAAASVLS